MPPLRLVFLGSDIIALPLLDFLADTADGRALATVTAVYTQPDRPHGRGQQLRPGPVKAWALAHGLPVHQPDRTGPDDPGRIRELNTDVALVMAYGQLLKDDLLVVPRLGVFNLHTSLLPQYRGASPATAAIASGDTETGVAFMRVVRRLDAGPVADVERRPIGPRDTTATIEAELGRAAVLLAARCLALVREGRLDVTEQDEARASYCRRLRKEDGVLDFRQPAAVLARRINALLPWPGCSIGCAGLPVKLGLAEALPGSANGEPGAVLGTDAGGLLVATGEGRLRLCSLQRPGGRMLLAGDFLRGFPLPAGTVLPSQPMPPLVAAAPFPRG